VSLFQCENCGCRENTAVSNQGFRDREVFDFSGNEALEGMLLCSACGPEKFKDGRPTGAGKWHGEFERVFLPLGQYMTSHNGNLERIGPPIPKDEGSAER